VAEGAGLENRYTGNGIEGSNPSLSAVPLADASPWHRYPCGPAYPRPAARSRLHESAMSLYRQLPDRTNDWDRAKCAADQSPSSALMIQPSGPGIRSGLASVLLAACVHTGRQSAEVLAFPTGARQSLEALTVPASYCRSDSGITGGDQILLTLHPGGAFSLEQTYRHGEGVHQFTRVFLGRWSVAAGGTQLWLDDGPPWLRRLASAGDGSLRIPDGLDRESSGSVHRAATPTRLLPFHDPFHLSGLVVLATPSR
jgi:hypothetical protein